jgi:multidrug efflux system outer membrane protein
MFGTLLRTRRTTDRARRSAVCGFLSCLGRRNAACALLIVCLIAVLTGCVVGPNYKRPDVPAPPQFRAAEEKPSQTSLGDVKWFNFFDDAVLRDLITEALKTNYDVGIAAERVIEAEGRLGATRSALAPQFNLQADAGRSGVSSPLQSSGRGFSLATWEIDLFGKLRRSTEAARAEFLASADNQKAVMQSLVAQVASAYFDLLEYDAELDYVRDSIATRQQSLKLVMSRQEGGVSDMLEVDQARTLVASAQASAHLLQKSQEQTENLINFLLAKPPGPVTRGRSLFDQRQPPEVPAGLPSALLERRPDLRAAEQLLVAANARVGVAKAAFYPSISLTAGGGYQSSDLLGVVNRAGSAYAFGAVIDLPFFDAGRRRGNYKTAQAQHRAALIGYQKAVNGAFRDVSDALVEYQKTKEYTASVEQLTETLRDQGRLANARYVGGVSSYLEVLDTERQRLTAEQQLAQAQRDVLTALVRLYKSLGGGWE